MRKHTDERPFKCDQPGCNKTFTRSDNCAAHVKTHARAQQNILAGRAPTAKGPIPKAKLAQVQAQMAAQEAAKQAVAATSAPGPVASTSAPAPAPVPAPPPQVQTQPTPPAPPPSAPHHIHQQGPPAIFSLPFGMAPPMPMSHGHPSHGHHPPPMMQQFMFDPAVFGMDFLNPGWPAMMASPPPPHPHQMPHVPFLQPPPPMPPPPHGSPSGHLS